MSGKDQKPDASPLESSDATLSELLQEAFLPEELDAEHNELLIEHALAQAETAHTDSDELNCTPGLASLAALQLTEQGDGASTRLECQQAQQLASALNGEGHHPLADLAEVLRNAYAPDAPPPMLHEQVARQALRRARSRVLGATRTWPYVAPAVALAAGVALWFTAVQSPAPESARAPAGELARTRSLSPLFAETLEQPTPTERMDRIYAVRSRELRHNRYTLWGVR